MTLIYKLITNGILDKSRKLCIKVPHRFCIHTLVHQNSVKKTCIDLKHVKRFSFTAKRVNVIQGLKGADVKKLKKNHDFRRLFSLAAPEKWKLAGAICFLVVSSSITMFIPFCLGKIIDMIYTKDREKSRENLIKVCLSLLGLCLFGAISNFARIYLMSTSGYRITQRLREKAYSAIISQETAMFDRVSTGELVGRLSGESFIVIKAS